MISNQQEVFCTNHSMRRRLVSGDVRSILASRQEPRGGVQRGRGHRRERGATGQLHDQNHQAQKGKTRKCPNC